jgi:CheY-like chemotaxis protein
MSCTRIFRGVSEDFRPEERRLNVSTLLWRRPRKARAKSTSPDSAQAAFCLMSSNSSIPLILLVEDSEDDAFFFRWTLDKCGMACDVTHSIDGAAAIEYLQGVLAGTQPRPDLIFLDLKIPTFTGFEVLAWIGQQHFEPPLDVAVLSGSEHAIDVQRAHALGASGYYVKPLSVEQLRGRFEAWRTKRDDQTSAHELETHACAVRNAPA